MGGAKIDKDGMTMVMIIDVMSAVGARFCFSEMRAPAAVLIFMGALHLFRLWTTAVMWIFGRSAMWMYGVSAGGRFNMVLTILLTAAYAIIFIGAFYQIMNNATSDGGSDVHFVWAASFANLALSLAYAALVFP